VRILLRYLGDGNFTCATGPDRRDADKIGVRNLRWAEIKLPRSVRQNNFIHAVFEQAWLNQQREQWENPAHLKAAAFCAVGHCDIFTWKKRDVGDVRLFVSALCKFTERVRGVGTYPIMAETPDELQVRVARPWSFDGSLGHEDATKLVDSVLAWLCSKDGPCPGADPDHFFEAAGSAA
jgi:hypothetical protein